MADIDGLGQRITITISNSINITDHFLIKYKNEIFRKELANQVIKIIEKFEIKDFHVEEVKAFQENRVTYNGHTIFLGNEINYLELLNNFRHYFKE